MRIRLMGLVVAGVLLSACGSSGPEPGSAEWCKTVPVEEQAKDPTAMMKCPA